MTDKLQPKVTFGKPTEEQKERFDETVSEMVNGRPATPETSLTFTKFSRINRQRCESRDGFNHALNSWSTSDWFLALLGELGEAANVAKKLNRYRDGIPGNKQSKEELETMLRDELGDSFVYLDLLAQSLGVAIGDAAVGVFNAKSEQLGCPIKIATEKNLLIKQPVVPVPAIVEVEGLREAVIQAAIEHVKRERWPYLQCEKLVRAVDALAAAAPQSGEGGLRATSLSPGA